MDMYTYEQIRKDVESGIKHMVLNIKKNEFALVDMCRYGYFNVKRGDGEEIWAMGDCKEVDAEKTNATGLLSTM
jgi:hypothetical protein